MKAHQLSQHAAEIRLLEKLLETELGDAIEGCSLLESVALLVSQRENARNACSHAMAESESLSEELRDLDAERDKLESRELRGGVR